jgi:replicative DNA helicase
MQQMGEAGSPIDLVTLCNFLGDRSELEPLGGAAYIAGLLEGVPDRPSISHHVDIVKRKADARNTAYACHAAIGALSDGVSAQVCIGDLNERLLQIQSGSDDAPAERVLKFSAAVYSEWERLADGSGDVIGLTTGVDAVDLVTTGIRPGETWAIGGRTGDGKTSLALQIAAANCRSNVAVGYFSVEMSKAELLQRLWSHAKAGELPYRPYRFPRRPHQTGRRSGKAWSGNWLAHVSPHVLDDAAEGWHGLKGPTAASTPCGYSHDDEPLYDRLQRSKTYRKFESYSNGASTGLCERKVNWTFWTLGSHLNTC